MAASPEAGVPVHAPRWLVVAMAVAAVALVAVTVRSGVAPSRELSIEVAPPDAPPLVAEPEPLQSCPTNKPVAVVEGTAYPPGFPDAPIAPPDSCFVTAQAAVEAGHPIAETPGHVETLQGMYLIPITNVTFDQCVQLAEDAGFEIPCLGRRPSAGVVTVCAGDCVTGGGYLWALRSIPSPPTWCKRCLPDVVVTAAPRDAAQVARAMTRCGRNNGGYPPWRIFYCDQQPGPANTQVHAANTMRRGVHDDIVFAVSAGGRGKAQRQLVNRVFESLLFVGQ